MAFIGGISAGRCSLLVAKENQKTTSDFDALDPTGCGPLRLLRALGGTRILQAAAPTAPPCIRRRRRSSPLQTRGYSPLSTPKKKSKRKNASRFAQRIFFASPIWSRCATDGTVKYILYLLRDSRRLTAADTAARSAPLRGAVAQRLRGLLMAEHKKA